MSRSAALANMEAINKSAATLQVTLSQVRQAEMPCGTRHVRDWDPDVAADIAWLRQFRPPTGPFSTKQRADVPDPSVSCSSGAAAEARVPSAGVPVAVARDQLGVEQDEIVAEAEPRWPCMPDSERRRRSEQNDQAAQRQLSHRQQLTERAIECIERMRQSAHDVEPCLCELEEMQLNERVAEHVLRASGAGKVVNQLRSGKWPAERRVAERAAVLLSRWKELVH